MDVHVSIVRSQMGPFVNLLVLLTAPFWEGQENLSFKIPGFIIAENTFKCLRNRKHYV